MMIKTRFALLSSLLLLTILACNAPAFFPQTAGPTAIIEPTFIPFTPEPLPATENDVPRLELEKALVAYSAGAATFIDVRSPEQFAVSHIPGAINIPLVEIERDPTIVTLPKETWIITYCT